MSTQTTESPRIALILGSVRTQRMAEHIGQWVERSAAGADLDVIDIAEHDLPLHELGPGAGESALSGRLHEADGFLVVTPEYNHSFPAALKNALDGHVSEGAYQPVAFVGYGAGSGGARAVEQLRQVFPELRSTTVRDAVLLRHPWERLDSEHGYQGTSEELAALQATVEELAWWARTLRAGRLADRHSL